MTEMACDNTDIPNYVRLIGEHEAQHGRVDIIVNNAGIRAISTSSRKSMRKSGRR